MKKISLCVACVFLLASFVAQAEEKQSTSSNLDAEWNRLLSERTYDQVIDLYEPVFEVEQDTSVAIDKEKCSKQYPALKSGELALPMSAALLEVRNLRVEFPTRHATLVALDDVSFEIAPGEILGVVGESGAGKSLTGAAIIGLLDPPGRVAAGEIRFDGKRIDNLPYEAMRKIRGRHIGAIFQDPLTSLNPL